MRARVFRIYRKLERYADQWWYEPLIGILSALDAFVFFVPNEAILAAGVLAKPKRWLILGIWMALGSAIGASALAAVVSHYSDWILTHFVSVKLTHSKSWRDSVRLINEHGWWGLTLISLGPLPQHAAIVFVGLTGFPLSQVFYASLIGRGIKYVVISFCAARSPAILRRWRILPREIRPRD